MSLDIMNLSFIYNRSTAFEKLALDDVSLSIKKGEFVLITGEVGSGKSTLIRHMNGLLKPCSGSVKVDGIFAHDKKVKSKVGMLFQLPQKQLFGKTVQEDISFAPSNFGVRGSEISKQVHDAMILAGLDESMCSLSPFALSGGQMRLVAMAGILAAKPDYLVLDEPCSGLDSENRKTVFSTLEKLNSKGISIIVVSHNITEFLPLVDRVLMMDSGKLVFEGCPDEYLRTVSSPLPDITILMKELSARGFDIRTDICTADEAFHEIFSYCRSKSEDGV